MINETGKEYPLDEEMMEVLAPLDVGSVRIGFFSDIHGSEGAYVPAKVTGAEVEVLVRHYCEIVRDIELTFWVGYSGSWEIRMHPYAMMRNSRFIEEGAISEERFEAIKEDVLADLDERVAQWEKALGKPPDGPAT